MSFNENSSRWLRKVTNQAIDFLWPLDESGYISSAILGRGEKARRYLARANWRALKGKSGAAEMLADLVLTNSGGYQPIVSLGGLLSVVGVDDPAGIWEKLRYKWLQIDRANKLNEHNFHFYALGVDLALRCEPELAIRSIKGTYFPFIWKFERCDRKDNDPIFYWHVPKTGGTSFNTRIAKAWYKNGAYFLPSYTNKLFFKACLEMQDGVLPYMSSAHLSSTDIPKSAISGYRKIIVNRDPKARALSAWRQYRQAPYNRLWVLPQHGFIWDFLPSKGFSDWLGSVPDAVVNTLSWTFSEYNADFNGVIDVSVPIEELSKFGMDLLSELGVPFQNKEFGILKNKTDQSVNPGDFDESYLEKILIRDYRVYDIIRKL